MQQLQYEIKTLTKEDREAILNTSMGDATSIVIPAEQVLAMKADLSITWNKLRVMRRYKIITMTVTYRDMHVQVDASLANTP